MVRVVAVSNVLVLKGQWKHHKCVFWLKHNYKLLENKTKTTAYDKSFNRL